MEIQDNIKKWVVLDNQYKKLYTQITNLRDEKNELTNNIFDYFDSKNAKYPIVNISDGKLSFIESKQPNALSYKFLEECFKEFFRNNTSHNEEQLLEFIKSKRTYNNSKNIKRTYNNIEKEK